MSIKYDQKLVKEVMRLGGFKFKKEAVYAALKEFVEIRKKVKTKTRS